MSYKVLIVGTVPYNKKSTSRAFDSYFHNWEKGNLAQIFSDTKKPAKGHCGLFYQITDQRLVKRRFNKNLDTGMIYNNVELPEEWVDSKLEVNSKFFAKLYAWGSKKGPLTYLVRRWIWKEKYWHTQKLDEWLDAFRPECVFLSFSDDFFIPQIALYVAERYNVPIVSSIGDDYYLNTQKTISPFYYIYKSAYRKLVRKVFSYRGSAIYIGNKIKYKYNSEFGLDGETVYLTSSIKRRDFKEINKDNPKIVYCGNIRLGRNTSLDDIGRALGQINLSYVLDVYSNESEESYYRLFDNNPNIKFHGSIPYAEVQRVILESDIVVVVEGFAKKDVDVTRYSLSTKVADSLASGANILGYGSLECGAIEYLKEINCGTVCTSFDELGPALEKLFNDAEYQHHNYENSKRITEENHNIHRSTHIFEGIVERVIRYG